MRDDRTRLRRWQIATVALMVLGYAGYYLCRSNFSVSLPLILDDLEARGIPRDLGKIRLGAAASWGVLAYAIGKFASGSLADFFGGRRNFLLGMAGSVLFTLLFASGNSLPLFTLAWIGNRLVQSLGWVGMVKITSRWFPYSRYASVMGILSLSFLFGDAAGRQLMGLLIGAGLGWRGVFGAAAASLALIAVANALCLRESPGERGLEEPEANPQSLFAAAAGEAAPADLRSLLRPFLTSPAFWIVCLLSFGFTLLREAFNTWTPTYFTEAVGLGQADAAARSALFPFFGGLSVLLAGFLGDASGRRGRAALILAGLLGTCGALLALASARPGPLAASALVALAGFLMIGPYSYLAGAISLDFGGKQGSATACGLIDGVGYLGGILSGEALARVAVAQGWAGAFEALAGVAAATAVVAAAFLVVERRAAPTAHAPGAGR